VFGFRKGAIQVRGAEKFFQKENRRREKARKRAARRRTGRMRRLAIFVALILIVAGFGIFMSNQRTQFLRLRMSKDREISALRSSVSTLSAQLEESDRQVRTLKESIAGLEKQVEVERSQRVRAEAALRSKER